LQDYYEGPPPKCLGTRMIVADNATLVIIASLSDFPIIAERLIPICGFEKPRIFLSHAPAAPEITGEQVIIVAGRESTGRARFSEIDWLPQDGAIDPLAVAMRLVPDAKNKLCLFASAEADGWRSVMGDSNWSQADE
jgi:hypothetical protein